MFCDCYSLCQSNTIAFIKHYSPTVMDKCEPSVKELTKGDIFQSYLVLRLTSMDLIIYGS